MENLFTMRASEAPWGDYGEILRNGMCERAENGALRLLRSGPFVPPITFPWPTVVVTAEFGSRLVSQGFVGFSLAPAEKSRIVAIDWQRWDLSREEPRTYPAGGEPENYILRRKHSAVLANQMPGLHELVVKTLPGLQREGGAVDSSLYSGEDFCRGHELGYLFVSLLVRNWMAEHAPEWVSLEPAIVVD